MANKAILSTWIEQAPASGSPAVTNDALHLAVRPEVAYLDNEARTFSLERPPLRPRLLVLNIRQDMGIGLESTAQRANMTDTVPHVVYADDINKMAVCLGQDANSTQAYLAFSSESAHNRFYLNKNWILERHIALDTSPVSHLFLREDALGVTNVDFNILGTVLVWVHRQGAAPVQVRASVF
jgi:hypothetical protein